MTGPSCKQHPEMQADLLLQQQSKFLSGQQPEVKTRIVQAARASNLLTPSPSYNTIPGNLETLSSSRYFKMTRSWR